LRGSSRNAEDIQEKLNAIKKYIARGTLIDKIDTVLEITAALKPGKATIKEKEYCGKVMTDLIVYTTKSKEQFLWPKLIEAITILFDTGWIKKGDVKKAFVYAYHNT
ncbi:MAG: hypothetical protein NTV89_06730, partial [Proteobacteria bacterium]|nr:hypothetical protein [Pseudomonadota bacterium]